MDQLAYYPIGCTFHLDAWTILAKHWYPIALAVDVTEQPTAAMLLDEPLVLYRIAGEIVVARDVCPHRGAPLSLGKSDGQGVRCLYHGIRYGQAGRCNDIPANPGCRIPDKMHLCTYPCVERYGLIWTCLAAPDPDATDSADHPPIPKMPYWEGEGFQQIVRPKSDLAAFAGRQIEGFLDVAHLGWLHTHTFGEVDDFEVPDFEITQTAEGFIADGRSTAGNYPIDLASRCPSQFEWLRRFEVHLPFTATLTVHFPDEGKLVIMNAASPVSARKTRLFGAFARNCDLDVSVESVQAFNLALFEEDRLAVEMQRPAWLPLNPALEAHVAADSCSLAYRNGLKRLGLRTFFSE